MKNLKQTLLLTTLLATLSVSPFVLADTQTKVEKTQTEIVEATKPAVSKAQDKANKKAIVDKANTQNELLKEVDKGIGEGLNKVVEATQLIKDDKVKEAIKALQEATGKFDIALAANPELGLIPIASAVKITELNTAPAIVKAQVEVAKDLLDKNKVQAARAILYPLQDDMVTKTTLLPMTTYPDAIKLATKMLVDGKKDAALATLATSLSTFVNKVSVIPLSLIRVEAMIMAAADLDKEKEKNKVFTLLLAAEDQLEIATLLGYTSNDSALYSDIESQIKALKKEAKGDNVVEKLYKKLKASLKSLIGKKSAQDVTS